MTIYRFPNLPGVRNHGQPLGDPVFWLGLQWAVTRDGVEKRDGPYVIERDRVWEGDDGVHGWVSHISRKGPKIDIDDFQAALGFARAKWPKGAPIVDEPAPRQPGTYPQLGCMVAWTPPGVAMCFETVGKVRVGPWPDESGWSDRYAYTTGACLMARHKMTEAERIALLFVDYNTLVVRDRLGPMAVHKAFLAIDEYRAKISPDTPGAS